MILPPAVQFELEKRDTVNGMVYVCVCKHSSVKISICMCELTNGKAKLWPEYEEIA